MNNNNTTYKDSPLGKIPDDWEVRKLMEITEKIGDGLHGTPEYVSNSNYYFINGNNIKAGSIIINADTKCVSEEEYKKHKKDLKYNALLMSINGTIGSIAFYRNESIVLGKSAAYINCKDENVDFLYYYLQSSFVLNFFEGELTGSTIRNLSLKSIRETPIKLPPLPEQRSIARVLSTMDETISKTNQLIARKELRKKWLMQQLLTGKKRLKGFSGDWKFLHIRDLAEEVSIRNKSNKQLTVLSCTKYEGLVPSLEYFGRKIYANDISAYKVVPRHDFAYATNHIEEGSIGYQDVFDEALISPMYTVFKTDNSINDYFFYKVLKSHRLVHEYNALMEGSIDRRGGLRWDAFSIIKFHLPSLEEQNAIVQILQTADKEIQLLKAKSEKLKEQKKGLMQVLLTGKKRLKIE
jgi:type I restriction enzyme S subunit